MQKYNPYREFSNPFSIEDLEYIYTKTILIRRFEETILELFSQGKLNGTTHAYIGQEANAVACISAISNEDVLFSNHRCHGHFIMYTDNVRGLLAELMGLESGVCGGKGGSQHLHTGNFYSNGIQGGIVPVSTGMALAEKIKQTGNIVMVFLGDGTLGQGVVYESMNIAALWKLPVLFILENNYYAQSTPSHLQIAGSITDRAKAFSIPFYECSSNDVREIYPIIKDAVRFVRSIIQPYFVLLNTFRLCHHSKNDDHRPQEIIDQWKKKDPLLIGNELDQNIRKEIDSKIEKRIDDLVRELSGTYE